MPIKKDIIYPIFIECCQYTEDIFWENIFEDLAYGKAPYGAYISKDFLCCSYKKKEFSYKIEKKDPKELYNDIFKLLVNKLGLLSQKEKQKKRQAFRTSEKNIKEARQDWGTIRKKNMRETLIELYVIRMKSKHFLNIKQARFLLSIIFIAMIFKVITAKDIDFKDGKIQHINGIDFNKKKVILKKQLYTAEVSFTPQIVIDKKLMGDSWEKYLKELRKLSDKN